MEDFLICLGMIFSLEASIKNAIFTSRNDKSPFWLLCVWWNVHRNSLSCVALNQDLSCPSPLKGSQQKLFCRNVPIWRQYGSVLQYSLWHPKFFFIGRILKTLQCACWFIRENIISFRVIMAPWFRSDLKEQFRKRKHTRSNTPSAKLSKVCWQCVV